jgi:hypothetical protein
VDAYKDVKGLCEEEVAIPKGFESLQYVQVREAVIPIVLRVCST